MDYQDPPLCANGCGFFGNPTTQNLCSKCYRDFLKQTAPLEVVEPAIERSNISSLIDVVNQLDIKTSPVHNKSANDNDNNYNVVVADDDIKGAKKKKKNRCEVCKKRVGLTGFTCQCEGVFCGSHRYPEEHCCAVDPREGRKFEAFADSLLSAAVKADKLSHRL